LWATGLLSAVRYMMMLRENTRCCTRSTWRTYADASMRVSRDFEDLALLNLV
jgi:hypothetical protein